VTRGVLPDRLPDRFRLGQPLGAGASKRVYRAHDLLLGREVALARFEDLGDESALDLALAEARALATVSTHEAVVTIFDVLEWDGSLYLVTEFLAGGNLADRIERGPLDVALASQTLRRITQALAFAHGRGLIHRDVKPANVLFDEQGDAYLADFGLAAHASSRESFQASVLEGTLAYMAPEQVFGSASPRSDLYALGCVLYETLTGELPFEQVPRQSGSPGPASPRTLNPRVPPALNRLCLQLLESEPSARPVSAQQVIERLDGLGEGPIRGGSAAPPPLETGWVDPLGDIFVSRQSELSKARSVLSGSRQRWLLVEGEPGQGKTTLLQRLAEDAVSSRYRIWQATALENASVPLQPILDLVIPHATELRSAAPQSTAAITTLRSDVSSSAFDAALYDLAVSVLSAAREQPLMWVIDDLHWADRASLRFLEHLHALSRSAPAATLAFVGATRTAPHSLHERSSLYDLIARERCCIPLQAFQPNDVQRLVLELTGLPPTGRLLDLLTSTAGGNPLFTRELLLHLDESGMLMHRHGHLGTDASSDAVDLPKTLRAVVSLLLQRLRTDATATLRLGACIGREFTLDLLLRSATRDASASLSALSELESEGWIVGQGSRYRFRHALLQRGVYDSTPNEERMRNHGLIARVLMATVQSEGTGLIEAANHAALACELAPEEVTAERMLQAARIALDRMLWEQVIRLCVAVLGWKNETRRASETQCAELNYLLGRAYHQLGDPYNAGRHLQRAELLARSSAPPALLARVLSERLRIAANFGHVAIGAAPDTSELEGLIEGLTHTHPSLAAEAMCSIANMMLVGNQLASSAAWAQRASTLSRTLLDDDLFARACIMRGINEWELVRPDKSLITWRQATAAARHAHNAASEARCLQRIPHVLVMLGRISEIPVEALAAREASARIERAGELTITITSELTAAHVRGDFDRARLLGLEGYDLMRQSGYAGAADMLLTGMAYTAAARGDWQQAENLLKSFLTPGEIYKDPGPLRGLIQRHLELIAAMHGDFEGIRKRLATRPPRPVASELTLRQVIARCLVAEAAWEAGEHWIAEHCIDPIRTANARGLVLLPGWPLLVQRVLGCTLCMLGQFDAARSCFQEALSTAEREQMYPEIGKIHLDLARLYALSDCEEADAESERHTHEATRLFERSGLVAYLESATLKA